MSPTCHVSHFATFVKVSSLCRYGKESPGPSAYNVSGGMGRQVLSDRESLPSWQMGSDKRFQYDFIKRTQGMPGPGLPSPSPLAFVAAFFCELNALLINPTVK